MLFNVLEGTIEADADLTGLVAAATFLTGTVTAPVHVDGLSQRFIFGPALVDAVLLGSVGPPTAAFDEPEALSEFDSGEREVIVDIPKEPTI